LGNLNGFYVTSSQDTIKDFCEKKQTSDMAEIDPATDNPTITRLAGKIKSNTRRSQRLPQKQKTGSSSRIQTNRMAHILLIKKPTILCISSSSQS